MGTTTPLLGLTLRNHCTVIAATQLSDKEAIVIALTNGESAHPYATWVMRLDDAETFQGDYCSTISEAVVSYTHRGGK